jgi:hypothetical protein
MVQFYDESNGRCAQLASLCFSRRFACVQTAGDLLTTCNLAATCPCPDRLHKDKFYEELNDLFASYVVSHDRLPSPIVSLAYNLPATWPRSLAATGCRQASRERGMLINVIINMLLTNFACALSGRP